MSEHVKIDKKGGVLAITLDRPERRNAITVAMYAALAEAFEQAARDDGIRVITLRGEGQDFAAGNDLVDFLETAPRVDEEIPVWRFLRALARCETPIAAAVQGNCVGIGTTMLLHCDLVIADESARFSLPFVDLGLVPEAASTLLLPRLAGRRKSARYLLLGEKFGANEAVEIGVVSHVAPAGALDQAFDRLVENLLRKPAGALKLTQRLLRRGEPDDILARMEMESKVFAERLQSDEVKQAISAFFSSRTPR
jgi:enoyl-CoA hydratase/carnithine racemase